MVRKTLWVALGLSLLFMIGGCGSDSAPKLDFVSQEHRFALNIPEGWTVQDSSNLVTLIALAPEPFEGVSANINVVVENVVVENVPAGMSLDDYTNLSRSQIEKFQGYKLLEEGSFNLSDGKAGYTVRFAQQAFQSPLIQRQLYVVDNRRAYVLTATAHQDAWDGEKANFDVCFDSFRVGW